MPATMRDTVLFYLMETMRETMRCTLALSTCDPMLSI